MKEKRICQLQVKACIYPGKKIEKKNLMSDPFQIERVPSKKDDGQNGQKQYMKRLAYTVYRTFMDRLIFLVHQCYCAWRNGGVQQGRGNIPNSSKLNIFRDIWCSSFVQDHEKKNIILIGVPSINNIKITSCIDVWLNGQCERFPSCSVGSNPRDRCHFFIFNQSFFFSTFFFCTISVMMKGQKNS